ncbi:MAG TPA: hypothetical protein PKH77_22010 [Anaerolineae bacterium]|nr:hypothetical protein [Anaerolineae bacterium]
MGTNAIIALTRNGRTVVKIVAGCDGKAAWAVARAIVAAKSVQVADLYQLARQNGLGCPDCLIVMDGDEVRPARLDPLIAAIYRQHFPNPVANPRTNGGEVYHYVQIDVEQWRILSTKNA